MTSERLVEYESANRLDLMNMYPENVIEKSEEVDHSNSNISKLNPRLPASTTKDEEFVFDDDASSIVNKFRDNPLL